MYINLADRTFSLIHWVPDRVTHWVGFNSQPLGEGDDQTKTRQIAHAGATHKIEGGIQSVRQEARSNATAKQTAAKNAGKQGGDNNTSVG